MSESILVVEDEKNVGSTLVERLEKEGFDVLWRKDISTASKAIEEKKYDIALLDVGLPDGSGFELASRIRKKHPRTGIVFLTAFDTPEHRVQGLELGAEDYVTKPFLFKELSIRLKNVLKRVHYLSDHEESIKIGRALVHFNRFEAETSNEKLALTHKECALLKLLFEKKGEVVSREEILSKIWSEDEFPTTRTVDNFILRLRKIVEYDPECPEVIRSVRGVGYQLSQDHM